MSTGNKAIPDLPPIPDPTGGSLYITKDSTDYRVDTGGIGGLATLGSDGKLNAGQMPTVTSIPWSGVSSKPTTLAGYGIAASDILNTIKTVDGAASGLDADLLDGQSGGYYTAWSNMSGTPTTISGYGITDAPTKTGTGASGTWGISITGNAGSATAVQWSGVQSRPNTLAGYGITNGMSTAGGSFTGGIDFGSGSVATPGDLSRHIALYGTTSGFSVTSSSVNYVSTGTHAFWQSGTNALTIGSTTVTNNVGENFGSALASGVNDLSRHINLHSTANYGFGVTSGQLNYNVNSTGRHVFYVGSTERMQTNSGGVAVTGIVTCTGNVIAYSSDERLKTNKQVISRPLDKLAQISGYEFDWNVPVCFKEGFRPDNTHEHGVMAQEVQKIVPDAIHPAAFNSKYLTVNYQRLIPLLIEAIKELREEVEELKANK